MADNYDFCDECGEFDHGYMVKDEIWTVLTHERLRGLSVCIGCLDGLSWSLRRRGLCIADFDLTLPINQHLAFGVKMAGRLVHDVIRH